MHFFYSGRCKDGWQQPPFSIEYQMHMVVVTASVARLVTTTTFLMSTSDGIRMEDLKSYVMRMVSRKAGRREDDHLQYCRVRLGH